MIFKFETFVLENYNSKSPANFFLLIAIAIFKPELLGFVSNIRNKYVLTATEVNQSILIELRNNKNIVLNNIDINPANILSDIESEWNLLKKVLESAKQITDNFKDVKSVIVSTNHIEIETEETSISVNKHKNQQLSSKEILSNLEINEFSIYKSDAWQELVSEWCTLLKANVKQDYVRTIDSILQHKQITWNNFFRKRNDTLGVRVADLPRLYYNNLFDLSKDLAYNQSAFLDYNTFMHKWLASKKNIFLNKIILPILQEKLNAMIKNKTLSSFFDEILNYSHEQNNHSFKLSTAGVLIKNDYEHITSAKVDYKFLINRKSDLLIILTNNKDTLKLLVSTSQIFPSKIKITSKQND